ncbi:hypothetical protein BCR43DRAFT_563174 [Syncephalastrum racemosum]|uniref:Zn(2)-C6 fungal-type domain-containing protein n=1 Tax=Syncephalastrum racemosum TaxID=13706 RepID=A0A1X2HFR1_SYNRA|nr:hypothetical protein BCR43DRAFT_563174 [Syncephalastrum racemosum]
MQSMPYGYQQSYQASSYSNTGSPAPSSSVMSTAGAPAMMTHTNGLPPLSHPALGDPSTAPPPVAHTIQPAPPKRKQVKNACTNCQKACKKCDDARPCPRCVKYGIADTCVNSVRKERKKGIKRGPYKRRQKEDVDARKSEDGLGGAMHPQDQFSAAIRPNSMAFGYPSNLNQYAQYDPYGYAAYYKEMQQQQQQQQPHLSSVYSSMAYPSMMMHGTNGDAQQQPSSQQPQGQQPSQPAAFQHSPIPQQQQPSHYAGSFAASSPQSSRPFGDHVLHQQSPGAGSPAHFYYQQPARASPHLADPKAQQQPATPIPSTSTSSGASSPPESTNAAATSAGAAATGTGDDDDNKFARLTQLCSAALHHGDQNDQQQQQSQQQQENQQS